MYVHSDTLGGSQHARVMHHYSRLMYDFLKPQLNRLAG